jgi:ATP/ADP translocase
LIQELENQWGLDDLEKGIRNKLDLFDKELSSIEQALLAKKQEKITEEQNYLNRLILLVTLISLASVTAQLLLLSPVADIFKEQSNVLYKTELYMVLLSSAIIILMALSFYSQKLRTKISKLILKRQDNIENNQRSQKYKQDKS